MEKSLFKKVERSVFSLFLYVFPISFFFSSMDKEEIYLLNYVKYFVFLSQINLICLQLHLMRLSLS